MGLSPLAMVLEREPLQWADLPGMLASWAQDAGGFAFVGLLVYVVVALVRRANAREGESGLPGVLKVAILCGCLSAICFAAGRTLLIVDWMNRPADAAAQQTRTDQAPSRPSARRRR